MRHSKTTQTSLIATTLLVCALLFLLTTVTAQAQTLAKPTQATITLNPQHPTPGAGVQAILNAPGIDMSTALVTWTVDGKVVQKSYGAHSVSFVAGKVGRVHHVSVFAEDGRNKRVSASKSVWVSDVVLVWEGKTYTPPFYKGRSLQSPGALVSFVAIPSVVDANGVLYNPDELSYIWKTNYSTAASISGRGKHSVTLKNDQPFSSFSVTMQVKDPQGTVRATANVALPVTQPQLVLYEDSSYVGIRYEHAIGSSFGVYDGETTVVAEPYHMTAETRTDPALDYSWTVGGTTYTSPGSIKLGSEGDGSGSAQMGLVIRNTAQWLQNARADVTVEFGQRSKWGDTNPETNPL